MQPAAAAVITSQQRGDAALVEAALCPALLLSTDLPPLRAFLDAHCHPLLSPSLQRLYEDALCSSID